MLDIPQAKTEDGAPGRRSGNGAQSLPAPGEDGLKYPSSEIENLAQDDAEDDGGYGDQE